MLQGDISQEIEKTFQRVVILGSPIFSSSPNDIVGLNLKKSLVHTKERLELQSHRLRPAELSEDDVVVALHNGLPVDVELPQQTQGIRHNAS